MENRFGSDFSEVRLHFGDGASEYASRFHARAYATGSHLVFGEGRYNPDTVYGLWLLAHELVHVVQQREGCRAGAEGNDDGVLESGLLEREADHLADLVVAGCSLPANLRVRPAAFGAIQRHVDQPCPGTAISAAPPEIYIPANAAIELAYKADPSNMRHANGILVGTDFDRGQIQLPKGAPNQRFGNMLLGRLRGLVHQRRPDVIDFVSRVIYEIKPVRRERQGAVQLASYYAVTDEIRREYAGFSEPPWKVEYATWYPPHVLPLADATLAGARIVCTQATDHQLWPGLLLYEVRLLDDEEQRRRRQRQTVRVDVRDGDRAFQEFWPAIRRELRRGIPFYDPWNPEYVIIIPTEYYRAQYQRWNDQMLDKFVRVRPSNDVPGAHEVIGAGKVLVMGLAIVAGVGGAVVLIAGTVLLAPAAAGAGAVATTGAVVETATTTGIIVETAGSTAAVTTAASAGGAVAGVDVAALAARAAMAAPQARNIAAGLGVLMVLATVKDATAASRSVSNLSAIRAVPLADFRRNGGFPVASSMTRNAKWDGMGVCNAGFGRDFALGNTVYFDGMPYNVIFQISAM